MSHMRTRRCLLDIPAMVDALQLELVGATLFLVANDDFVNFRYGIDEVDACGDRYSDPCSEAALHRPVTLMAVAAMWLAMNRMYVML